MNSRASKIIKISATVLTSIFTIFSFSFLTVQASFFNCNPSYGNCTCGHGGGEPICIGFVGQSYNFKTKAVDPEGNRLYYTFFWDDAGSTTRVPSAPNTVESGVSVQTSHMFNPGLHNVSATATDTTPSTSVASNLISCDIHKNAALTIDFDSGPSKVSAGTTADYYINYTVANDNAYGLTISYSPIGGGAVVSSANPTWSRVGDNFYWDFNNVVPPGNYSIRLTLRINGTTQNHVEIMAANPDCSSNKCKDDKWVIVGEAWWQTNWGDIHSNGGISNRETHGSNTADYVVTARQGINSNVKSSINQILTPYPSTRNLIFTEVNKDSLTQGVSPNCSDNYWRAVYIPDYPLLPQTASLWRGGNRDRNIHYCNGNLTIAANPLLPKPSTILNSEPPALFLEKGGTVVVDGDLSIANNVYYDPNLTTVDERAKIPSAGFVIGGDLVIASNVKHLVGNFYVLGDVYTNNTEDTELIVEGSVVARNYLNLERKYIDEANTPSELVKYDGRVLVNPPPGFLDPAMILPRWAGIRP